MGGWLVMLMVFSLLLRWWRNFLGAHEVITESHYHDVGKLCFAFTAFWGYLTFSQFLVIWYGNWAEETHRLRLTLIQPWTGMSVSVAFLVFGAPFFGLLGKAPKLFTPTMAFFASCSIIGIWMHRYLEVYPPIYVQTVTSVPFGIWEIGTTLGFLGLWGYVYLAFMDAFPRMRVVWMTSPYRDEMQIPVDAAHDGAAPGARVERRRRREDEYTRRRESGATPGASPRSSISPLVFSSSEHSSSTRSTVSNTTAPARGSPRRCRQGRSWRCRSRSP